MESNDNNNQVADSSGQEFQYEYGTYGWFGPQLKDLSNVMNAVGQQMRLQSETLKNADPCQELILGEVSQREIVMNLSATTSDVADILDIMLRDWSEIEKSNQSSLSPPEISEDMADNHVTKS